MEHREPSDAPELSRHQWVVVVLSALVVAAAAFAYGAAAAASPNNCGELPGIASLGATLLAVGAAGLGLLVGAIVSATSRRWTGFGIASLIALAMVGGVILGTGASHGPC